MPAIGTAGDIAVGWNSGLLSGRLVQAGEFSIIADFLSKKDNLRWLCTVVYGPNERALKQNFWDELRRCKGASPLPWVICGNFNTIFAVEDKPFGDPNLADIRCANAFMRDLGLLEPLVVGRKFTWTNG